MIKICKIVSLQFLRYKLEHNQISRSEVDKVGNLIKLTKVERLLESSLKVHII